LGQRVDGVFGVMIDVYDTSMIFPIKEKLIKFLFENDKVANKNKERLLKLDRLQAKIGEQLFLIDSLQRYEYFKEYEPLVMRKDDMFFLQKKDKRLYDTNILDLYRQQIELKRTIAVDKDSYDIRVDFGILRKGSITLKKEVLNDELIFFILGILLIFFKEKYSKFKEAKKKEL